PLVPAEGPVEDASQEALVPLPADRIECDRAVGGAVVADRRHALLRDRQLEPERARRGDDLRPRRRGGDEAGRRCENAVDGRRAAVAEGYEKRRHERHDRQDDEADEPAQAARGPALAARARTRPRTGMRPW